MALLALALVLALQATPAPHINRVAWLQGCWELHDGNRVVEEQWLRPRASSMLGTGRTTRGDRLMEYEFVLIRESGDQLAYEAHPSDQDSAIFMSTNIGDRAIVFENLKHDFPQRIGYERRTADTLLAWVEGPQNGQTRRIEFPYAKVACPGDER